MATTEQILDAARKLGDQIGEHPSAKRLEGALQRLSSDIDAQRLLADQQRAIDAIMQKEAAGKPIEVADKRKLEDVQQRLITNRLLNELQMAQMDYLDLMRQVDDAISGATGVDEAPVAGGAAGGAPGGGGKGSGPALVVP